MIQIHTDISCPRDDLYIISDCLDDLGLKRLAKQSLDPRFTKKLNSLFLDIIRNKAIKLKRHDVIERLEFAGLIYG